MLARTTSIELKAGETVNCKNAERIDKLFIELHVLSLSFTFIGMNIFVAFFVLLLVLAESTPPASPTIPLIGDYQLSYLL